MTVVHDEMERDERYFELYKVALGVLHTQHQKFDDWAAIARDAALVLMRGAALGGAALGASLTLAASSAATPVSGSAFVGWDEGALQAVLLAAINYTTLRVHGAAPEALANVRAEIDRALDALLVSRQGGA